MSLRRATVIRPPWIGASPEADAEGAALGAHAAATSTAAKKRAAAAIAREPTTAHLLDRPPRHTPSAYSATAGGTARPRRSPRRMARGSAPGPARGRPSDRAAGTRGRRGLGVGYAGPD